jgi:very-short-patch-repair endonuclease
MKFKRQKPIGYFIVDFVCHECNLIIELDGGQHAENIEYDAARDAWLRGQGFTVLRFWNNDVMQKIESVLEAIRIATLEKTLSPAPFVGRPLPQAGRGETN